METKTCRNPKCAILNPQPIENFKFKARYKDGVYSRCRTCETAKNKTRHNNNPEPNRKANREYYVKNKEKQCRKARGCRLKQKYWPHLTYKEALAEWDELYAAQKGLCKVCEKPKLLEVDHCHKTGIVRALLCNGCNTAVARVKEDLTLATNLYNYIKETCLPNLA